MDSALVIKVKYGDSLRRFSVSVDENNRLDLNMVKLRTKILSLFNIPADANFIMRYVDEDGDLMALLDDDDLRDVMRQRLKFLRINVDVSDDSVGKSDASFSGSVSSLRASTVPNQFLSGNVAIADALKSVLDPLLKAPSNLSLDIVSKAASSSPVVATFTDCISKTGPSILNSDCQPLIAAGQSLKRGVPEEPITAEGIIPQSTCVESNSRANQKVKAGNVTKSVVAGVSSIDSNILPCEPYPSQSTNVNTTPLATTILDGDGNKGKASTDYSFAVNGSHSGTSISYATPNNISTQPTTVGPTSNLIAECPFSGTYITDSVALPFGNHCQRSQNHTQTTGDVFHKGIRCNGCGLYPITGPRFKSKMKENYNLCSICLNEMSNLTDYIKMDHPLSVRSPQSFKGHHFRTGAILKHARPKLDSRFILDVDVIHGTIMAPSTTFTKIWRMQNNGTSVWPKGTKLVWVGGNMLSDSLSVDLEIPEDGVPLNKELDIVVELRAPQLPGQYISYWRMACPFGQTFGQRIWVLIQVEASLKDSSYEGFQGLNFNIPHDASGFKGHHVMDVNAQSIVHNVFPQPHNSTSPTELVKQKVNEQPKQEPENGFLVNESTFESHNASHLATSVALPAVSCPIIDFSKTGLGIPSDHQSLAADAYSTFIKIGRNNSVEETLLKELEEMGFRQVDLNKDILRMNEYDLEQSVNDLLVLLDGIEFL